jgi:hypothetical protein
MNRRELVGRAIASSVGLSGVGYAVGSDDGDTATAWNLSRVAYPTSLTRALVECLNSATVLHALAIEFNAPAILYNCDHATAVILPMVEAVLKLVAQGSGYARAMATMTADAARMCAQACARSAGQYWQSQQCMQACQRLEYELRRL